MKYSVILLAYMILLTASGLVVADGNRSSIVVQAVEKTNEARLKPVECWFGELADAPPHECYNMQVPENHSKPEGRKITFPVLVFRNPEPVAGRAPLLHLGAGGPGAPMYLDSGFSVGVIWQEGRKLWLDQGRDFIVIDPRGSGLARPLLTCDTYVKNVISDLQKNLSLKESSDIGEQYYLDCFRRFQNEGIELGAYNSLSVVQDVEMLRQALGVKQWVLYGVSHAATYAQLIVNEYPDSVAAMILDSATFPDLKPHHTFPEYSLSFYEALYDYCDKSETCKVPLENMKQRFWALHAKLSETPIKVDVPHPDNPGEDIPVLLTGNLFVETMLYGLYGKEIFDKVPEIIIGLEQGSASSLVDDISWYLSYLLDDVYGDVSAFAHHCYETEPFTDHKIMKEKSLQLPAGYIRESALLETDWGDICPQLDLEVSDPKVARATKTDIPTLFLHGELDTVTPLKNVRKRQVNFSNSQLLSYPLSHGVLGVDECADEAAAAFLLDPKGDLESRTHKARCVSGL